MKLFLNACGLSDLFRLRIEDKNRSEVTMMSFQRPYVVVGRSTDADLALDHWQVSRRHCYFQMFEGRLFCLDLGSRTGTHWDGKPGRWRWLAPGDSIHVGPYRIWCEHPRESQVGSSAGDEDSGPIPIQPAPGATLERLEAAEAEAERWRIDSVVSLIGRSPACHVRLSDPELSKFHSSLVHTPVGVWIIDLHGVGGVSVNQIRVRCARLSHGDEFLVGRYRFRLNYDHPEAMSEILDDEPYEAAGKEILPYQGPSRPAVVGRGSGAGAGDPDVDPQSYAPMIDVDQMPESVAIAQALLAPMMQQFSMMQQQMFENFHQTMVMMMRSMQAMHREHMDVVQQELDEVRKLTRELHALQAESARIQAERMARPAPNPAPPSPQAQSRPPAPSTAQPGASSRPQTAQPGTATRPQPSAPPTPGATPHRPQTQTPSATTAPPSGSRPFPGAPATPRPQPSPAPARPQPAPAPGSATSSPRPAPVPAAGKGKSMVDAHAQLQQRILTLQNERQTRWQKILAMVGGGDGKP